MQRLDRGRRAAMILLQLDRGVPRPAVAMGERGGNQAPDVDLPDALWPGPCK